MTYKEIYDKVLPEKKRKEEKHNWFGHYVGRPISILMTMPLINTAITPTLITKISIIFSIIGFALVSFGQTSLFKISGWICFFLWNLLDGVDGNLARCTNQCSQIGDLWDTMGGYIAMVFTYFSAGIAAYYDNNLLYLMPEYIYLMVGGFTALMSIFPRLILQKKKSYGSDNRTVVELTDTTNAGTIRKIVGNIVAPSGLMQVLFLVAIIFKLLNLFLICYFIMNFMIMMVSLNKLLKD